MQDDGNQCAHEVVTAIEREQRRIAARLHDDLCGSRRLPNENRDRGHCPEAVKGVSLASTYDAQPCLAPHASPAALRLLSTAAEGNRLGRTFETHSDACGSAGPRKYRTATRTHWWDFETQSRLGPGYRVYYTERRGESIGLLAGRRQVYSHDNALAAAVTGLFKAEVI